MVIFYSTLSPQKCTKLNTGKQNAQGRLWSNIPLRGKIEILEKRLSPATQKHCADKEDTCRDKVMNFGVIVRYTKKGIEKNEDWGQI